MKVQYNLLLVALLLGTTVAVRFSSEKSAMGAGSRQVSGDSAELVTPSGVAPTPVTCNVEFCEWCVEPDYCSQCQESLLNVNGQCIDPGCTDPNCNICDQGNKDTCYECRKQFYLDQGICVNPYCDDVNCLQCSQDQKTCFKCSPGYDLKDGKCECITQEEPENPICSAKCVKCQSYVICDECQPGYYTFWEGSHKICKPCSVQNCGICPDDTSKIPEDIGNCDCEKCADGYHKIPFGFGDNKICKCLKCNVQHCSECNDQGDKCLVCQDHYGLVINPETNEEECIPCFNDAFWNGVITWQHPDCLSCDYEQCKSCDASKNQELYDGTCRDICLVDPCYRCQPDNENICIDCNRDDLWLTPEGTCEEKKICPPYQENPVKTDNNGNSYTDHSSCVCISDYYWDEQKQTCIANCHLTVQDDFCDQCEDVDGYKCKVCHDGFQLQDGSCIQICLPLYCSGCVNFRIHECDQCNEGYYKHTNENTFTGSEPGSPSTYNGVECWRTCDDSVNYCTRCEDLDSSKCKICHDQFYDVDGDGQCDCDINGCVDCYDDNQGKRCETCGECRTKSNDEKTCYATCDIPSPCAECKLFAPGDDCEETRKTCVSCIDNTYKLAVQEDGRTICVPICNDSKCDDCSADDRDFCNHCIGSWTVVDNKCTCEIPHCTTCSSEKTGGYCDDCWSQYDLTQDNTVCDCKFGGNHCLTCDDDDFSQCTECDDDKYTVQDGQCVPSPCVNDDQEVHPETYRCKICVDYDLNDCEICLEGYVKNPKNSDRCDPPCSDDTCKICSEGNPNGKDCTECIDQYHYSNDYERCWPDCVDQEGCQIPDAATCTCSLCKDGWFWDYKSQLCTQICQVNHCDVCTKTSAYKCQTCNENYHHFQTDIDDNTTVDQCECLDPQCLQCTTDGTICEVCKNGLFGFIWLPVNGECYPQCLVPDCDHCKDKLEGTCEPVCKSDFVATSNQFSPFLWDCLPNCNLDIENDHCSVCDFSTNPLLSKPDCCGFCIQGWHVEDCKCVPDCNLNEFCDTCVEGNPDCCDVCLSGLNFEKSDDGCSCSCIQGYVYYDSLSPDQCKECLPEHCTQCKLNDQNTCIQCELEYKVVGGQCERKNCTELEQDIYGCEYCSTNGCCDECQTGFVATSTGEEGCFYCDLPCVKDQYPHCETCVRDGTAGSEKNCDSCRTPNYYLDGNVCKCSVEHCSDCSSDNLSGSPECKQCSNGYNLNNEKTECIQCPELRTWSVQQNKCVCITNYIEVGSGVIGDGEQEIAPGCYPKCSPLNKGCSVCQYVDLADTKKGKYCLACTNPDTQKLSDDKKKCIGQCDVVGCQACTRYGDTCICEWEDQGWLKEQKVDNLGNLIREACVPEPCGNNCFECQNNNEDGTYDANVCVDCDYGYDLIDGQCVKPCNQDPKVCSECYLYNPDCCETCTDLYSVKNGQCNCERPCNLYQNHCNLCVEGNANSCEECQIGYVLVDIGGGVFECQLDCSAFFEQVDTNCIQCAVKQGEELADIVNVQNQLRCTLCKSQWWVPENGICKMKCDTDVVVHCQKCKDDQEQNCELCVDTHPWIVLNEPDGLYGCHPDCDDPHCIECAFDDNTKCEKCEGDNIYKIDQNNDCIPNCQDPHCITCKVETLDICDTCQDGWTPDQNGVCKQNCLFFDNNCTTCDFNQVVKNDRCFDCTPDLWELKYIDAEGHWVCWPYCEVSNCYRCADQDSNQCAICEDTYHIHEGQCVPDCDATVTHCLYCNEQNRNQCVVCDSSSGATQSPDANGVCPNICESFKGANCLLSNLYDESGFESVDNCKCDQCNFGYVHNPADQLSCICDASTMTHCSKCSIPGTCEECDDVNWHVVSGQCELKPCPSNCLTCPEYDVECCSEASDNHALCGDCETGQYIKSCIEHDQNCVECTCSHCTKCDVNHELDPETSKCYYEVPCYKSQITGADNTVYKYFDHCEQCEATEEGDPLKGCCIDCIQRYYVSDCQCEKCGDPHCLECPNGQCNQCELYYGLDINHECQKCSDHCKYCDGDTTQCKECDEGYYNIDGKCYECSEDCKVCTNDSCLECKEKGWYPIGDKCNPCTVDNCSICPNDLCEACIDGYFFKYYQNNWLETIRECDPCKVSHCFACSKGPNTCTQCEEGWELPCEGEDDKCIQSAVKSAQNVWNDSGAYANFIGEGKKQLRDRQLNNNDN